MKKYAIAIMALALSAALFTGCGCQNTDAEPTTTSMPTTEMTTVPTTQATVPTTEAPTITTAPTDGIMDNTTETAGEDGFVENDTTDSTNSTDAAENARTRSRSRVNGGQ